MFKYVARRVLISIPLMIAVILFTFVIIRAIPGGPFDFAGQRTMPPEVKAALENRYGLDRPLFLNLPGDGAAPDVDKPLVYSYRALPDCELLRQGVSREQQNPKPLTDTIEGWALLRTVTERRETQVQLGGRNVPCLQSTSVLYSDLFRSQFFEYLFNLTRGDLGVSLGRFDRGIPVNDLIGDRLPVSAQLGLVSLALGFLLGVPLGVIAALRRNRPVDYTITFSASFLDAIPTLVLGPLLIYIVVVQLKWLPGPNPAVWKGGSLFDSEYLSRAILPILIIGLGSAGGLARLTRVSLLQVLQDDYVRTARSKGLRERRVIYLHALKNALIPVATIIGPAIAGAVTGSLIIERVFSIPGIGAQFLDSVNQRDYTLLTGVTVIYAVFLIAGNILVDVMYAWLDPRIRFD